GHRDIEGSGEPGRFEEGHPLPGPEGEMTKARILGIPQVHVAVPLGHLDTVTALAPAVAGLPPGRRDLHTVATLGTAVRRLPPPGFVLVTHLRHSSFCYQTLHGYGTVPHRYGPVPGDPSPVSPTHRKSPMSTSGHRASDHLGHPQKDRGQTTENSASFGRPEEGPPLPGAEGQMAKARVLGIT